MGKLFQNGQYQNLPGSLTGSLSSLILLERSARAVGQSQRTGFLQHIFTLTFHYTWTLKLPQEICVKLLHAFSPLAT